MIKISRSAFINAVASINASTHPFALTEFLQKYTCRDSSKNKGRVRRERSYKASTYFENPTRSREMARRRRQIERGIIPSYLVHKA